MLTRDDTFINRTDMIGSLQNIAPSVENATEYDVNREVNNGRGPVDFKVSKGSKDTTLVEFKLASNTKLKKNLENQVEIYKKANCTAYHSERFRGLHKGRSGKLLRGISCFGGNS